MKVWIPLLVGIAVSICFGSWWVFRNESPNNCPFYVAPAITVVHFLRAFFWPLKIDLPVTIFLWFLVALLIFLFWKISLARLKKGLPVLAGIVAGLCFGIWTFFHYMNSYDHPFYAVPFFCAVNSFRTLIDPQKLDLPVVVLLWFIYCTCLGALLGFLFQLLFGMFWRLKRPDTDHQIKARPNLPPS
jgi:hypothetical protein